MSTYHANNEYCLLSDFVKGEHEEDGHVQGRGIAQFTKLNNNPGTGFKVLVKLIERFDAMP